VKRISLFGALLVAVLSIDGASAQDAPAEPKPSAPLHLSVAIDVPSAISARAHLKLESSAASDKLHVIVGQSVILRGSTPIRRIYIGNPAVLQTFNGGPSETVLTAKQPGISSLVIWDDQGKSCLYTVTADLDPSSLREAIANAYPGSAIEVTGLEDRITLSGAVPTAEVSEGMAKLAANYTKDVVNSLRVVPVRGKQVQLKLRIAEVDRSKLEQFAVNLAKSNGNYVASSSTQQYSSTQTSATSGNLATINVSNPFNFFFGNVTKGLGVNLQDLETRNILQILAEPNLTTMSGVPARFLSGGEFPFPVAQGGGAGTSVAISIQFRPYGVKVDFTPTVNGDGSIHLKIMPEVSTLDYTNAVAISGFTIPALSTRRTETEVELKDGESYAISGLLDRRASDNLSKTPGIANVPILGEIFKSKNLNHSTLELVIVVTASVVDPLKDNKPVTPAEPLPHLNVEDFDKGFGPSKAMEKSH
jgi:pilus assembly protein CpaC